MNMTILQLISSLRSVGVNVWAKAGQLCLGGAQPETPSDLREELLRREREVLDALATAGKSEASATALALRANAATVEITPAEATGPLSPTQQRFWLLDRLEPGRPADCLVFGVHLRGRLNVEAFRQALDELVHRHDVLRTCFRSVDPVPVRVVQTTAESKLREIVHSAESNAKAVEAGLAFAAEEYSRPFDLTAAPLARFTLMRFGDSMQTLIIGAHRIVFDHWSWQVFLRDLVACYQAFAGGTILQMPSPTQFADFVHWQTQLLDSPAASKGTLRDAQLRYWAGQLGGNTPAAEFPLDRARPAAPTFRMGRERSRLPPTLTGVVKAFCDREGVSAFLVLLAAWQALLYRYSGQPDLAVGCPISYRVRPELEDAMGPLENVLALRSNLTEDPSFSELLTRLRETVLGAFINQDLPLGVLLDALKPPRSVDRHPLYQVMFEYQTAMPETQQLLGLQVEPFEPAEGTSDVDLVFSARREGEALELELRYAVDLFDRATAARILGHMQTFLEGVTADPTCPVTEIPLPTEAERHQIMVDWNAPPKQPPAVACLHRLFEDQVARTPNNVAVSFEESELTYRELNARANQLARALRAQGVGPESLVGLCVERSPEIVIGILGILKAGGAYVPLDPSYPAERLQFMVEDSHVRVVVTQAGLASKRAVDGNGPRQIALDRNAALMDALSHENLEGENVGPESAAYVIYTSGSTGTPKGVVVTHANVARLLTATEAWFHFHAADVWTLFHSYAFDFSVWEMWGALLYGGRLVVVPYLVSRLPQAFHDLLIREKVTVLNQTPSAFRQLMLADEDQNKPEALSLRYVIFGGEALHPGMLEGWFRRHGDAKPALVNMYGITETTVHVTYRPLQHSDARKKRGSVIGQHIPDLTVYLLDKRLQSVPVGVAGEIFVGGAGVVRGYLNRDSLTRERFLENPFGSGRLYRTGDLARWLPDGDIEYLGRGDFQVKIRGLRIELGEIETLLYAHPGIREGVVLVREDAPGDRRLVAYIVADGDKAELERELRRYLHGKLPDYMVPSSFVWLNAMPQTPSGKLDRRALPKPEHDRPDLEQSYVAPASEIEQILAQVWGTVLNLSRVGVRDTFFDLGGNSLLILQVLAHLKEEHGIQVPAVKLFQYPTIASLATYLAQEGPGRTESAGTSNKTIAASVPRRNRGATAVRGRIAIVGMAGRFPGARDVATLWRNLCDGRESITFFSDEELDPSISADLRDNPSYVKARGILENADTFDAAFFGINPREAEVMDPQQRVFLETAWEVIENAGYCPESFRGRIGVYGGEYYNSYYPTLVAPCTDAIEAVGALNVMLANDKDFLTTRVSHRLNLTGPSVSIHTACSTSLVAVIHAVRALLDGWCDMAVAGGVSVTAPIKSGYLYEEGAMLSPDGHCRPFDAGAQGTTFSDGVALVALRRLEDAVADGDQIHAVILGTGINNDGSGKVSFTAPSVEGQAGVVAMAHADAGVEPESISYIEAHGTGTPLGDPIEIEALARVFRLRNGQKPFCAIGSIKSNFGHLTAAAGTAGLIKTALALRYHLIPPTVNFEQPNPRIGLDRTPFYINIRLLVWESASHPLRAGVSSFGVGGTNAHIVLEEPPERDPSGPSRPRQLLLLSARSSDALDAATANLAQQFRQIPDACLADAAFTLQTGRRAFSHRRMVVCSSPADAAETLGGRSPMRVFTRKAPDRAPDVAFMFPGQGAQYVEMGVSLYTEEPLFRETVDRCAELLVPHLGRDLREVLYPEERDAETAAASLRETSYTQPALFTIEYALARVWMSWGVHPVAMVGHSIGEYVAACLADVFSLEDALMMVATRGRLMQELPGGAMLSVRLPASELAGRLTPSCAIAAVNGPALCVVAGPTDAVAALQHELEEAQVACRPLHTSHAFHSPMMDPIIEPFAECVRSVRLSAPRIPFVSTVTAEWITKELSRDPMYWARQLRQTVRFADGVQKLWQKALFLLEVGPRTTTATLARQQASDPQAQIAVSSLGDTADIDTEWTAMLQAVGQLWLAGIDVDWRGFYAHEQRRRVSLPTYPFERTRYWLDPAVHVRSPATNAPSASAVEVPEGAPELHNISSDVKSMVDQQSRKTRLIPQLKEVFEQASGIELDGTRESATFLELGLDSLFLTQVALNLKKRFGVPVTFRQMLEEFPTLGLLADFLDRNMPPEALPPQLPTAKAAVPSPGAAQAAFAPLPVPATDGIRQLFAQQLQLIAQQLQLLGLDGRALLANAHPPVPAASGTTPSSPPPPANPPFREEQEPVGPKKSFGAGARISTAGGEVLTPSQREGLHALAERYTGKTARSKESAQASRRQLADPRVVSGFRPLLKELVYPIVVDRAAGSRLWDIDGNEYVDLTCGFGSCFLGWSPPFVTEALRQRLDMGFPIGPQTPLAGDVAHLICELTGHERAALCNTGSEAVLGAMRLARTVTGRTLIAIFSGAYHGILDEVIVRGTRKLRSIPAAAGIPPSAVDNVLVLDYGTAESLDILRQRADQLAAILVEPVQSRNPGLQPRDFLHELRRIAEEHGAALIFDEVVTGFRVHPAGAQGYFGIKADLGTYGKVIGGGMPIGVIAGQARFMDGLDGGYWQFGDDSAPPAGVTYFAGTFVRHPLTLSAAKVVLEYIKAEGPELQQRLNARSDALAAELNGCFDDAGVPLRFPNFGSVFHLEYTRDVPYGELLYCWLREKGVHAWDGRPCFLTTAHTNEDLNRIVQAFKESLAEMQQAEFLPRPARSRIRGRSVAASHPPVPGARLGRMRDGTPAWFVPDPERPGKYVQIGGK